MRITKIESQEKSPRRKNIVADGEFVVGVSDETLLRSGLRTGDEITDEQVKALIRQEEASNAQRVALRFLARRPRTAREIRDRLREEEYSDTGIEQAIASLKEAGLVNDAEFARMYISDAISAKATGKSLLRRKLLLLGIEKAVVDDALQKAFAAVDEHAEALEVGRKFLMKSTATRKPSNPAQLQHRLSVSVFHPAKVQVAGPLLYEAGSVQWGRRSQEALLS